jgi:phosphoribosyl-ATP pyrophosphohydrolase
VTDDTDRAFDGVDDANDDDASETDGGEGTGSAVDVATDRDGEGGGEDPVLDELFAVIEDRRDRFPEGSYTASLVTHEKGENAVLEKIGEEATETILAAKDDDREGLAGEAADVVYHLLVLLAMKGMTLADLRAELRERR